MYKRTRWGFALLALVIGLGVWILAETRLQYGIDLVGGSELTYSIDLSRVESERDKVAGEVKDIITNRLNVYGLKDISVAVQGRDQLVVQLPGQDAQSVGAIKQQIETAGTLEFRLEAIESEQTPERQAQIEREELAYVNAEREWVEKKVADPNFQGPRPERPLYVVRVVVEKDPDNPAAGFQPQRNEAGRPIKRTLENSPDKIVSGSHLKRVSPTRSQRTYGPAVFFEFDGEGAFQFGNLTGSNVDRGLAITLDNDIIQVANISERIGASGEISGQFTQDDVIGIVTILRGGSLPAKPALVSESTVGSVLGQDSIQSSLQAVLCALAIVMLIMAVYYLAGGLVANFALVLNIFFILTYVACFRQTLTLPGMAGILLTVGMAVDANILIFERVREELKKGKPVLQALASGYRRAFWVIFDANLTTFITGMVLFQFGTGPVKGFAVTLISGIVISFITAIFVTRLIVSFLVNVGIVKSFRMLQAFETPNINFPRVQRRFLTGSVFVIVATWVLVIARGSNNYGIDFTGGARINMQLSRPISVADMKSKIATLATAQPELFRDWTLQTLAGSSDEASAFALRTRASEGHGGLPAANAQESESAPAEDAATSQSASTPPADAGTSISAAPSVADGTIDAGSQIGPAQRVRSALEDMLRADNLLLPPLIPLREWKLATDAGSEGNFYLTMDVNFLRVEADLTEEDFKDRLNAAFAANPDLQPRLSESGTPVGSFTGISVESVSLVSDTDGVKRYQFVTNAYQPPVQALRSNESPPQTVVEEAFTDFFHSHGPGATAAGNDRLFELSEAFSEVATVGPKVASTLQQDAIVALFISMLGIIFYVSLRFEFIFGVAAIVALVHDILISIGLVAMVDYFFGGTFSVKINLAELAAILTIVGYSINDTIVIFDRIRENMQLFAKKRMDFKDIVNLSINQTLTRTLWTSLTTLCVTFVLLFFATEAVSGFAFIFLIGILAGTYSSVFVASPVLIILHARSVARRERIAMEQV